MGEGILWVDRLKQFGNRVEFHHVINRSRGGPDDHTNLLALTVRGHQSFHTLFSHKTLLESATELRRWNETKGKYLNDFCETELFKVAYQIVFKERTFLEAAEYLELLDSKLKGNVPF